MKSQRLNLLIARLLSGQSEYNIDGRHFIYSAPTISTISQSEIYYNKIIQENKFFSCIRKRDIKTVLYDQGLWNNLSEKHYKNLPDEIDNIKLQMYNAYCSNLDIRRIRQGLKKKKDQYDKLLYAKNFLFSYTLEGYATALKNEYIIQNSLTENGEPPKDIPCDLFDKLILRIKRDEILSKEYRYIARNDPWISYWAAGKEDLFGICSAKMNDEQRAIITYSKMYDNAYSSAEPPKREVVDDDDLFDGWIIKQRKDNESAKEKSLAESRMSPKVRSSQNVGIVVGDRTQAKAVENINNPISKKLQQQRLNSGRV